MPDLEIIALFVTVIGFIGLNGFIHGEKVRPFLQSRGRKVSSPFVSGRQLQELIDAYRIAKKEGHVPRCFKVLAWAYGVFFLLLLLLFSLTIL